jgi:hypothetical protein
MSQFEDEIAASVRAEIGRVEAELVTLRDLLRLLDSPVDSSAVSAPKRKYTRSKKSKTGKKPRSVYECRNRGTGSRAVVQQEDFRWWCSIPIGCHRCGWGLV